MTRPSLPERFLATCQREGGTVVFPGASGGTARVHDEATDTWSVGSAGTDVTGYAMPTDGDPAALAARSLVAVNPVTLMIAAHNLAVTPVAGVRFVWGGVPYTVVLSEPHGAVDAPTYHKTVGTT